MRTDGREELLTETRKESPISSFFPTNNGFRFVKDGRLRFYDLKNNESVEIQTPDTVGSAFFKGEKLGWFRNTSKLLWFTKDGGANWYQTSAEINDQGLEGSLRFFDAKEGVLFNNSEVWLTTDNGHRWVRIYPTSDQSHDALRAQPINIYFADNVILLAMTNGEILRWSKKRSFWSGGSLPVRADILSIHCFSDEDCLAGASGGAGMFRSKDAGKNWIRVKTRLEKSNIVSIAFGDSTVGIGIEDRVYDSPYDKPNYEGTLIRTTDGGVTWTLLPSIEEPLLEAHFVGQSVAWVLGEKSIFVSKDAGESWQKVVNVTDL